jgi:pyridoxamine 5'-phosphate oxidase family protein
MSAFTDAEIEYLTSSQLGRLATVGPDGQPHIVPVTFIFHAGEDAIDIGGLFFGASKKWRDAQHNPKVCFLVDESWGSGAKGIEIRGDAELHETGGDAINLRFSQFAPQFFRIRPRRIVAWGIDPSPGKGWSPNARDDM